MGLLKKISASIIDWLAYEHPPYRFPMSDFNRLCYEIRPGDVLLIEGRSRVSEVIKLITLSRWSHAVLYMGRIHDIDDVHLRKKIQTHYHDDPDAHLIIESIIGKGTVINNLNIYKNDHIRICRPKGLAHHDAMDVMRYALQRLGYEYDVRQILDLARYLFPWVFIPRKFRSTLFRHNAGSHTKIICSTLLAEAFGSVHFPVLPEIKQNAEHKIELEKGNPRLITPSDFDYSPYFEIIKSPPIELSTPPTYRTLPWRDKTDPWDQPALQIPPTPASSEPISTSLASTSESEAVEHQLPETFFQQLKNRIRRPNPPLPSHPLPPSFREYPDDATD